MPFCEECAKYWAPSAMNQDGTCRSCGRVVETPQATKKAAPTTLDGKGLRELAGKDAKAPWHFKVLVGLLVLYLGWRVVDLVGLA